MSSLSSYFVGIARSGDCPLSQHCRSNVRPGLSSKLEPVPCQAMAKPWGKMPSSCNGTLFQHLNTNETVGSMYISFKLLQYLQMLHKLLPTCSIHNLFTATSMLSIWITATGFRSSVDQIRKLASSRAVWSKIFGKCDMPVLISYLSYLYIYYIIYTYTCSSTS